MKGNYVFLVPTLAQQAFLWFPTTSWERNGESTRAKEQDVQTKGKQLISLTLYATCPVVLKCVIHPLQQAPPTGIVNLCLKGLPLKKVLRLWGTFTTERQKFYSERLERTQLFTQVVLEKKVYHQHLSSCLWITKLTHHKEVTTDK